MSKITLAELFNDLPDDMLVSANTAKYPEHRKIWYILPSIAACLVIGISAVLYPKLRTQTPDITAPSASTAESSVTTTVPDTTDRPETQTVTASAHPAVSSATVTVRTTAKTSETPAAVAETLSQTDDLAVTAAIAETNPTTAENRIPVTQAVTETTALTEQHIETTDNSVIPVIIEDPTIEIPLWKGIVEYPESVSEPHLYSRFSLSTGDMDAWMRSLFGIPQDFDLTQNQCLLIEIDTAYSDAVIIGCRQTPNGLTLIAAYLDDGITLNKTIHYAMPIPDNMTLEPDNCNANYLELTDEELIQEMEKEKLELKTGNEQEELQ